MEFKRIKYAPQFLKFIWKGHIANWMWLPRDTRRLRRETSFGDYHLALLSPYLPFIKAMKAPEFAPSDGTTGEDPVFALWLQDESNAPELVKKCIASVREKYPERYVLLNETTLNDYVEMPGFLTDKWKKGIIGNAHYADLVRLELLARHGGFWSDVTNFFTGRIPEDIEATDFFMFVTSDDFVAQMFVQNCFIRAKKGHPLVMMWRQLLHEYWRREDKAIDYFVGQMLFKLLVTHNETAKAYFEKMPKKVMDPTHQLWHFIGNRPFDMADYNKMTKEAFFQKTTYKKHKTGIHSIEPGSLADYVINGKVKTQTNGQHEN